MDNVSRRNSGQNSRISRVRPSFHWQLLYLVLRGYAMKSFCPLAHLFLVLFGRNMQVFGKLFDKVTCGTETDRRCNLRHVLGSGD